MQPARWLKPVGTRLVRYGPQAQLAWKYAGKPATAAAQRAIGVANARRTALRHAETVVQGAIVKVFDQGAVHWVVYSAGAPIACYPPTSRELSELVRDADLNKLMTPEQFRSRQAELSRRRRAVETARLAGARLRRRGLPW